MPAVTADTPLTVKQTKFAARVATGMPKAAARREVYAESPKYPKAARRRAAEMANQPHVAAEIRRLTWLSCPPVEDARGMREHSVRILSDLSRSAASEEVKLKAALALYRIAETTLAAAAPGAAPTDQDKLLASLRRLYTEVQGVASREASLAREAEPEEPAIDIRAIAAPVEPTAAQAPEAAAALTWEPDAEV